jgi:xanthine/uracil permease
VIKKLFPPVVCGACVMLIGGGLLTSGMKYLGGGVFCGKNTESRSATFGGPQLCAGDNGDGVLAFGSPEYVGLGMSVVFFSIILQMVGSPFLKSTFLFWSLLFGVIMAAVSEKDIDGDGEPESYFRKDYMEAADKKPVTFFRAEGTFPIDFSPEYFIPIVIGFVISTAESIGDVSVTSQFSGVAEEETPTRVQGGLLADGINSFIAALFGSPPNTTFSQVSTRPGGADSP